MNKSRYLLLILVALPLVASAGWLDKVADIIKEVSGSDNTEDARPAAKLIKADISEDLAANTGTLGTANVTLPAHWQTYWLDEPVFNGRIFIASTGNTNAPVMLLVHGLGQNGLRDWLPVVPALEKDFHVVMVDLPGFALSAPPKAKLSPTHYAALLHFIKPFFSSQPITVVGHSMGGAVTLRYAHQYPADVKQIGLIDAAGILQRTAFIKHSATGRIPTNPEVMSAGLLEYAVGLQDFGNAMVEKMVGLPDPSSWLGKSETAWGMALGAYPNINAAMSLVEENYAAAGFETKTPVAILWGAQDPIAPLRTGQVLAATLPKSHLTVLPNAKHVPMASHADAVGTWLLNAFPLLAVANDTDENHPQDYHCDHQAGQVLTGAYKTLSFNECTGVLLQDVVAEKVVLRDSVIEINNSRITSAAVALDLKASVAVVTGGQIAGEVILSDARLDIAGTQLDTPKPFVIEVQSRIVASVCRIGQQRYLHDDIVLNNQRF